MSLISKRVSWFFVVDCGLCQCRLWLLRPFGEMWRWENNDFLGIQKVSRCEWVDRAPYRA